MPVHCPGPGSNGSGTESDGPRTSATSPDAGADAAAAAAAAAAVAVICPSNAAQTPLFHPPSFVTASHMQTHAARPYDSAFSSAVRADDVSTTANGRPSSDHSPAYNNASVAFAATAQAPVAASQPALPLAAPFHSPSKDTGAQHHADQANEHHLNRTKPNLKSAQRQLWPEDESLPDSDAELQAAEWQTAAELYGARPMDLGDGPTLAPRAWQGNACPIAHVAVLNGAFSGSVAPAAASSSTPDQHILAKASPNRLASADSMFGSRPFPQNMSCAVRHRLHEVVAANRSYLMPDDFDATILNRLANMPEVRAMRVLQIAANVYWQRIENNTKYLMTLCCRTA